MVYNILWNTHISGAFIYADPSTAVLYTRTAGGWFRGKALVTSQLPLETEACNLAHALGAEIRYH
jgi:hypothetical protein